MPVLTNPRWEHFAHFIATGKTPAQACACAGYTGTNCGKTGLRLLKNPIVRARVDEIKSVDLLSASQQAWLERNFVLYGLKRVYERAMVLDKLSEANVTLKLLGLELGMFRESVDHTLAWDGDFSKLTEAQLAKMAVALEQTLANQPVTIESDAQVLIEGPAPIQGDSQDAATPAG